MATGVWLFMIAVLMVVVVVLELVLVAQPGVMDLLADTCAESMRVQNTHDANTRAPSCIHALWIPDRKPDNQNKTQDP